MVDEGLLFVNDFGEIGRKEYMGAICCVCSKKLKGGGFFIGWSSYCQPCLEKFLQGKNQG